MLAGRSVGKYSVQSGSRSVSKCTQGGSGMPSCPLPLVPHMTTCCLVSSQKEGASASVWTDSFSFPKLLRRLSIFSSNSARIKFQVSSFKFSLEINAESAKARRGAERNSSFFLLIRGFKKFPVSSGQRRLGHKKSPSKTEGLCNPTWLD